MSPARSRPRAATLVAALTGLAMLAGTQPAAAAGGKEQARATGSVVKTADGAVRGVSRTNYDAWLGMP
jgi:para-nitrobenzyl esterase